MTTSGVEEAPNVPRIEPVSADVQRPKWSVMIPTFNCAALLRRTLTSVLQQDPGSDQMQICVVDDCSTKDDPAGVVAELGSGRVEFVRGERNIGATNNFNRCIQLSRGELVHILHGDDFVLPRYYETIQYLANESPAFGIFATRVFFVNEDNVITGVEPYEGTLQQGTFDPRPFFYRNAVQFAGVAVRRSAYELAGGFRPVFTHVADCEMWSRLTASVGLKVSPEVLACYRIFDGSDTSRLAQTAQNIREYTMLVEHFAQSFSGYSIAAGIAEVRRRSWVQYEQFASLGMRDAADANLAAWRNITPPLARTKLMISRALRRRSIEFRLLA